MPPSSHCEQILLLLVSPFSSFKGLVYRTLPQALSRRRQSTPHPIEEPQSERLWSHSRGCKDGLYTAPRCPVSRPVSNTQGS